MVDLRRRSEPDSVFPSLGNIPRFACCGLTYNLQARAEVCMFRSARGLSIHPLVKVHKAESNARSFVQNAAFPPGCG